MHAIYFDYLSHPLLTQHNSTSSALVFRNLGELNELSDTRRATLYDDSCMIAHVCDAVARNVWDRPSV